MTHLNPTPRKGLFGKQTTIAKILNWKDELIKKPLHNLSERSLEQEALQEMFTKSTKTTESGLSYNIIVKGSAKLLKGIIIKDNLKEHEALDEYNKRKDLKKFFKKAETGFYWSNVPNEIHRVFSIDDYISYETSTPELDDVIRIKDDTMRASGLILSEHK